VKRSGESWKEWVVVLLLLAGVAAFVVIVIVIGLAVALCHGRPPFQTLSNPNSERIDP
jgi:hypothetical protein